MAQTATILITDLVGSTETRVRLGEDRAEDVRRAHDTLLTEQAAAHGGNVIKGLGDGVLVAFAGAAGRCRLRSRCNRRLTGFAVARVSCCRCGSDSRPATSRS